MAMGKFSLFEGIWRISNGEFSCTGFWVVAGIVSSLSFPAASSESNSPLRLFKLEPGHALAKRAASLFTIGRTVVSIGIDLRNQPSFTVTLAGEDVVAVRTSFVRRPDASYEWIGHIQGDPASYVLLVYREGKVVGRLERRRRLFLLKHLDKEMHALEEVDMPALRSSMPPESDDVVEAKGMEGTAEAEMKVLAKRSDQAQASSEAAAPVIDVLVLYDQAVVAHRPDIDAFIRSIVAEANNVYVRSGISLTLRLARAEKFEAGFDMPSKETFDRLRDNAQVSALRKKHAADLVSVLTANPAPAAWGLGSLNSHLSLVYWLGAETYQAFTHELGHSMGADHNREEIKNPQGYNFGFLSASPKFATVMAYQGSCDCDYIKNFSNPSVYYNGGPTGIADFADNARAIRENAPDVAGWMTDSNAIQVAKTGQGRIRSDIGGIDCGQACSKNFHRSEVRNVNLTAIPDAGWKLGQWSGDCSGNGSCAVVMDDDRRVSATFVIEPGTLTASLFDVAANRVIAPVESEAGFRTDTLPKQFTIQANASSAAVNSVKFELSGAQFRIFTTSTRPFTLFGSPNGQPLAWTPTPLGRFNLTLTQYEGADGAGNVLNRKSLTLDFNPPAAGTFEPGLAPFAGLRMTPQGFEFRLDRATPLEVALWAPDGRVSIIKRGKYSSGLHAFAWLDNPGLQKGIRLLRVTRSGRTLYQKLILIP